MKSMVTKLVCGIVLLLGTNNVQAQSVDSLLHNGEYVYIYPFRQEVDIHSTYWKLLDDKAFFLDYNNYFDHFEGDYAFDREAFQKAKTPLRKKQLQEDLAYRWKRILRGRGFGNALAKSLRKQPGELLYSEYTLEKDLLPPFGNIPDGNYVQLFEEFCLVDENGKCQANPQRIAGIFEIKNNVIEGNAVWLNFTGDTLKEGSFVKGLKEDQWLLKETRSFSGYLSRWNRRFLKDPTANASILDTGFVHVNYKNGLEHGQYLYEHFGYGHKVVGEFDSGEPTGEWTYYSNDVLTERLQIASREDTIISHKPLIRGMGMQEPRNMYARGVKKKDRPVIYPNYMPDFPRDFYSINYGKLTDERELEGESEQSFGLTDGETNHNYNDYNSYGEEYHGGYLDEKEFDPTSNQTLARWFLIDSLGVRMHYDGVYEKIYYNGQRFFRYEFVDGQLLSEDTIFWSNGVAHDVIIFEPDSNKYYRNLYDRNGKRYDQMIYDSLGAFIEYYSEEIDTPKSFMIDSFLIEPRNIYDPEGAYLYYNEKAITPDSMFAPAVLYRTWSLIDTTLQFSAEYDPLTFTYEEKLNNYFGECIDSNTRVFTPNFSGWNGVSVSKFDGFTVKETSSGVLLDDVETDTLGHTCVKSAYRIYDVTSDQMVYTGEEPFTGAFSMTNQTGASRIKSGPNTLKISLQKGYRGRNHYYRTLRKKGGNKEKLRYSGNGFPPSINTARLSQTVMECFREMFSSYEKFGDYEAFTSQGGFKKIEGQFLDGKPHGTWTAYSKGGKVASTLNFIHGEPEGELRIYDEQDRARKVRNEYEYFEMTYSPNLDTFPTRKTEYLKHSVMFKNGLREGLSVEYDWLGRTVKQLNFENGLADGDFMMREPSQFTKATFKFGRLDGYLRTYLTLPKMDTLLLYDLNLQHGTLNGESRAYHTNGSLAKRGFFLDNEPIDDYEAYDTLGFKFHYIKFQYGQPIEEKIWEENALSIRYQFNWEDSIEFNPDELTESLSFEALLARNGYYEYSVDDRYYGRPSLIDKDDIECQMTKYYPNDTIARDGQLADKRKTGLWKFYGYKGNFLYEATYFDSVIVINDSVQFKTKGILTDYDENGNRLFSAYIIEKFEKYDCAHTDHYEVRQLLTIDEVSDSTGRMNGYVQNFYDNGTIQGEGTMKNGLPDGLWKFYDPFGKLNKMGNYVLGKRNGRWLEGDLAKKKYLGEICMNPNLEDLEEKQHYQENLLDITIINYMMGVVKNKQYYDVNMNRVLELEENRSEE